MNKLFFNRIIGPLFLCMAAALILLPACRKESMGRPVITSVRNYQAAPNDTAVQTVNAGQWVVLLGQNLSNVTQVYFDGVPATINTALFAKGSLVVQIPSIPFQSVPNDKKNTITVVSETGTFTFTINVTGPPLIVYARNYAPSPKDTIANTIYPGQKINLIGYNLKNATAISFQGVLANLTGLVYTDSSVIVQVPVDLSGGDATLANTITYTTAIGSSSFPITIIGPPIIIRISYENPNAGDSVYLYGNNFFSVQSLKFAGATVPAFTASPDGTTLGFVAPTMTQSGPVVITTQAGAFTTAYNVNDISTGAISNFEWAGTFHWDWWGGANLESGDPSSGWPPYDPVFAGNSSLYLQLKNNVLAPAGGDEFSTAIRIGGVQWLPAANLSDPLGNWALKFETDIPASWNGGTLCIKSSNGSYMARYEPWQISAATTAPYKTNGWRTVVIPLSSFRKNDASLGDGMGVPVTSINVLLGNTGTSDLILYMHNYGSSPTATAFNGAFDNFRVTRR